MFKNDLEELQKTFKDSLLLKKKWRKEALTAIAQSHKRSIKNYILDCKKHFEKLESQLILTQKKSLDSFLKLHKELFVDREFTKYQNNPAFMVYAGITLIVFYCVLEVGLGSGIEDFVNQLQEERFSMISCNSGITIQDFNDIKIGELDTHLKFSTNSSFNDKVYARSNEKLIAKIKNVYKIV